MSKLVSSVRLQSLTAHKTSQEIEKFFFALNLKYGTVTYLNANI
jgi:hypothetical protein